MFPLPSIAALFAGMSFGKLLKWGVVAVLCAVVSFYAYKGVSGVIKRVEEYQQNKIIVEKQTKRINELERSTANNAKEVDLSIKSGQIDLRNLDNTLSQLNAADVRKADEDKHISEKIDNINEVYKNLPKDSAREKQRLDRISKVRIDALWATYCTNNNDPECPVTMDVATAEAVSKITETVEPVKPATVPTAAGSGVK